MATINDQSARVISSISLDEALRLAVRVGPRAAVLTMVDGPALLLESTSRVDARGTSERVSAVYAASLEDRAIARQAIAWRAICAGLSRGEGDLVPLTAGLEVWRAPRLTPRGMRWAWAAAVGGGPGRPDRIEAAEVGADLVQWLRDLRGASRPSQREVVA